jgi:hypothetical protein
MNTDELIALWQRADANTNMDKAYEAYSAILNEPGLSFKLTKKQSLDVRYNRVLNNVEIANWYFVKKLITRALTHMNEAVEDARYCSENYDSKQHRQAASALLDDCEQNLATVEAELNTRIANVPSWAP